MGLEEALPGTCAIVETDLGRHLGNLPGFAQDQTYWSSSATPVWIRRLVARFPRGVLSLGGNARHLGDISHLPSHDNLLLGPLVFLPSEPAS